LFGLASNHVLLDAPLGGHDAAADGRAVVDALRRGRGYLAVDALASADAFGFMAEAGGRRATMGETLTVTPGETAMLEAGGPMPAAAEVRLLKDGHLIETRRGPLERVAAGPGVYRVEVRLSGWSVPWIVTNPIVIADAATVAARRQAAADPTPAPVPAAAELLADFEKETAFHAAADSTSE